MPYQEVIKHLHSYEKKKNTTKQLNTVHEQTSKLAINDAIYEIHRTGFL